MKTLEQVFGKITPQPPEPPIVLPPLQLPDESRTVLFYRKDGSFKGQATYWYRNNRWELIGCTPRNVNDWLYQIPFHHAESALTDHGYTFKWVPSFPFSPTTTAATTKQSKSKSTTRVSTRPEVPRSVH